jgi:branched-chain amino acid transport system permease protein
VDREQTMSTAQVVALRAAAWARRSAFLGLFWILATIWVAFAVSDRFVLSLLALGAVQALYAASWDLLGGVSGQVSLGHALPFGGGAYLAVLLARSQALSGTVFGRSALVALAVGTAGGALLGALQGAVGRRLNPVFLALVTLATAEIAHELSEMLEISGPGGGVMFGGEMGVASAFTVPSESWEARLASCLLAAGLVGLVWLIRSRLGLAMRTVRSDPRAAAASGIDGMRVRFVAFLLAGAIAGLAGALTAGLTGRAVPPMLTLETSFFVVIASGAGGSGTIVGPAVVAYFFTILLQWLDLPEAARVTLYSVLLITVGVRALEAAVPGALSPRRPPWRFNRG